MPLPESDVSSLEMEPGSVDAPSGQAEHAEHPGQGEEGASSTPPTSIPQFGFHEGDGDGNTARFRAD